MGELGKRKIPKALPKYKVALEKNFLAFPKGKEIKNPNGGRFCLGPLGV